MRSCISREPAVSGACCQRTFLRLPPCKVISTIGETTACLRRSILRCCWKHAKQRAVNRAPRPGSSTVNRSRRPRAVGRGYDAAKKVKGRKRHIVTDTGGLLVGAEVHPADVQDRDGAVLVIEAIHQLFPWLRHLFADSVYNGPNLREALAKFGHWTIEIVKRAADAAGFKLLPRRWVVERTLAWLNRNRRLARISRLRSPVPKSGFTSPPCSCSLGDSPDFDATYTIKIWTLRHGSKTYFLFGSLVQPLALMFRMLICMSHRRTRCCSMACWWQRAISSTARQLHVATRVNARN